MYYCTEVVRGLFARYECRNEKNIKGREFIKKDIKLLATSIFAKKTTVLFHLEPSRHKGGKREHCRGSTR